MEISRKFQIITFITWIVIVPPGVFLAFTLFPSKEIDWLNLSILFAVLFVTMTMPLQIKNITVSLERWITFTVFSIWSFCGAGFYANRDVHFTIQ